MRLILTSLICAPLMFGCGHPQLIETPTAPAPKAAPKPAEPDDAFADFGGRKVAPGTPVRLEAAEIVGIKGHRLIIQLMKTEWTSRELPSGKVVKEATADLRVERGTVSKRKRIDQDETRTVHGAKITVRGAGEQYSEKRMDYVPWVEIVVQ